MSTTTRHTRRVPVSYASRVALAAFLVGFAALTGWATIAGAASVSAPTSSTRSTSAHSTLSTSLGASHTGANVADGSHHAVLTAATSIPGGKRGLLALALVGTGVALLVRVRLLSRPVESAGLRVADPRFRRQGRAPPSALPALA